MDFIRLPELVLQMNAKNVHSSGCWDQIPTNLKMTSGHTKKWMEKKIIQYYQLILKQYHCALYHLHLHTPTCLQMSFASSENLSEYSSWSSRTRLSTSSRLTRSLRLRKGDWPCIISKIRQPSPHQSGLTVQLSFWITSGAEGGRRSEIRVKRSQQSESSRTVTANEVHEKERKAEN